MFNIFSNKRVTEKLYEQNLELAIKNKILALLEKLYQTGILALTPEEMAQKISDVVCKDLNFEFVGILTLDEKMDILYPLAFSYSERFLKILNHLNFSLKDMPITGFSNHPFFKNYGSQSYLANNLKDIWIDGNNIQKLPEASKRAHIKTILAYPLIVGEKLMASLIFGLNRDYNTLNSFEKESIKNLINVVSLLLDRAYIYKELKVAYEIEKKAKEELEKLDKFKDQFLMVTQHNLRTPLTSMMGYTDLLLKGFFGKQNKKTVEVMQKFQALTQGMIRMVNNFLDMAQFQLGKGVVALKPGVDVEQLINEIVQELSFKAESKGVYVKLERPEKKFTISADREKLKAALFNIIDNAVKYTEKGGVTVAMKNHDTVKIIVSDTGIGIAKDKLPTIFEQMFERSEQAKKVSSLGSGVGLYLSGQIIKAHNGKVWAESEGEGKGSVFYIELPIANEPKGT